MDDAAFALPRNVKFEDCLFYHTVDIPGHGVVRGQWDLRQQVDTYLGGYRFAGKRVLEIGPASGFLTCEMERRGADVVALEVPDDPGWDFVPYPEEVLQPICGPWRQGMTRIKNSFWFLHQLNGSKARLRYGDACDMPSDLGTFDVAVMASVLLHCERPVRIIAECAKRADTLIVTDMYYPELEGRPVCRFVPNPVNEAWDTWWQFSTDFFRQYFAVLGFPFVAVTQHHQVYEVSGQTSAFFTAIGSKSKLFERVLEPAATAKPERVERVLEPATTAKPERVERVLEPAATAKPERVGPRQLTKKLINGVLRPINLEVRRRSDA